MKLRWCLALPALLLLTGCIGLAPKPSLSEDFGQRIEAPQVRFIHTGQTTRAEVIAHLGTNYTDLPQGRAMAYSWETKGVTFQWYIVVFALFGGRAEPTDWSTGSRWQAYFLAFDRHGVVQAHGYHRLTLNNHHSLHEQLAKWVSRKVPENADNCCHSSSPVE